MKKTKSASHTFKYFGLITQFGLNNIICIGICLFGSIWIKNTFNLGDGIVFIGFIIGTLVVVTNFINLYKVIMKDIKKEDEERENYYRGE